MKKYKVSMILNIIIALLTLIACIMMFTGIKFMDANMAVLETSKIGMFKFFTVDSNVFMGIMALVFAIQDYKIIKNKITEIPEVMYSLKLMSTVGVTLTFIVVFAYLGPISSGGIVSLLLNSNLFFHLIIPILSIITFVLYENTTLSIKSTFLGIIPFLIYAVFYSTNVIIHVQDGLVSPKYDWYWFLQNGIWTAVIVLPIMIIVTYLISYILWKFNTKNYLKG